MRRIAVRGHTTQLWVLSRICLPILAASFTFCAALGCSTRNKVPADLATRAEVVGFPDVRDFADSFSPTLQASFVESIRQEVGRNEPASILALSGGGADGAFGAGFLCGWSKEGTRPTFKIVTGISTGALIAPFAFLGPAHDEALKSVYTTISTRDIYVDKSMLERMLAPESLLNTTPLGRLIAREFDESFLAEVAAAHRQGRRLFVGTTNIDTGQMVIWDMGAIAASGHVDALKLFRSVLLASSAIPLAFPPIHFPVQVDGAKYEETHWDGGLATRVFLFGFALDWRQAHRDAGVPERPAHLYIVRNGKLARSWTLMLRPDDLPRGPEPQGLIGSAVVGDLYRIYTIAARAGIDFNLAFIPDDYVSKLRESFDKVEMNRLFELAYDAASRGYKWLKLPPGLR